MRSVKALSWAWFLLGLSAAPVAALPACVGTIEAKDVKAGRVERNGAVILEDGRAIKPEGIRLPDPTDRGPKFLGDQAVSTITDFAQHRALTLAVHVPKFDRYGRIRAQILFAETAEEPWLQVALLRRGLARVFLLPDRGECASELLAAEAGARAKRYGLWASSAYAIRNPNNLGGDTGTFQIVEGRVHDVNIKNGRAYIDFGADWERDFTVTIAPADLKLFKAANIDVESYLGKILRVRGIIQQFHGLQIELYAPGNVEVVKP